MSRRMRRAAAALAAGLAAVLALSACGSAAPSGDGAVVDDGPAITAAQVSDNFGDEPEVTLPPADQVGDRIERRIVVTGDGPAITTEDTIIMKLSAHDLGTGQSQGAHGYLGANFTLADPNLPPYLPGLLEGVPAGSRIAAIVPGADLVGDPANPQGASPALLVMDVQTAAPGAAATGVPQEPTQSLVTVSAEPGAAPEITVHSDQPGPAADGQVIDVVLAGDGATVEEGDLVTVQYTGLLFSDGTEFDSSWSRGGAPASFPTTGVVTGFADALVGQQVGSRIVTVFGSDLGYEDRGTGSIPPGSTLVFVIDIIATM